MQVSTTWALTCPEMVHQRPCMTRENETWLSDSGVGNNSVVDHRNRRLVLSLHCVTVSTDVMSDHIVHQQQHTQASLDGLRWFEAYCHLLLYDVDKKVTHCRPTDTSAGMIQLSTRLTWQSQGHRLAGMIQFPPDNRLHLPSLCHRPPGSMQSRHQCCQQVCTSIKCLTMSSLSFTKTKV